MNILEEISMLVQKGNAKLVPEKVKEALNQGISAEQVLNEALVLAMSIIGEKFKNNEVYVPEVLIAARAMKAGMEVLKPILTETGVKPVGKVIIGTVKGDLHDIGKNLVAMMMTGAGLEVIDLGVDVAPEKFCEAVKEHSPQVLAMSALLTTTMPSMKDTIDMLEKEGLRNKVKVMVGGAPVTESFANSIGADAYTKDAASAAEMAKKLAVEVA